MAETNLSISRVENGFVIEDYRPADCGFKGTVLVAETSTGLAALVAAWAAQFEATASGVTKIDIREAGPVETPWYPGGACGWVEWDGSIDRCPIPHGTKFQFLYRCERERMEFIPAPVKSPFGSWIHTGRPTDIVAYRLSMEG